jgi:hypothetical protein
VYSPATRFSCIASDAAVEDMKALAATPFRCGTAAAATTLDGGNTAKSASKPLEREKASLPTRGEGRKDEAEMEAPGSEEESGGGGGGREQA